jgi:hypothetical protein
MRDVFDSALAVKANLKFNVRHSPRLGAELAQDHIRNVMD